MTPRATYRLQFHKDFDFAAGAALAPYLAALRISHVYCSPFLKARPGSTHGYDIVDHGTLNPELGGERGFQAMAAAYREHGLGLILDFVPNHMGVGGADNPVWLDVLEWGQDSAYAGWFDVDWESDRQYLHDKILVPLLADQYGVELEQGKLALTFDRATGSFAVWAYGTHMLPVSPLDYPRLLSGGSRMLARAADSFADLPAWRPEVVRRAQALKKDLAALVRNCPEIGDEIGSVAARFNGSSPGGDRWQNLDELIRRQHWRLASFRAAADDINYRRFFNINELAGLRMELPAVYEHAHRRVIPLLRDGTLSGMRIDHIDGLLDPKTYLQQLRRASKQPFYLVVEKILAPHESLREDWPVDGTTGYEFTNQILGLLIDSSGEVAFGAAYASFTGHSEPFASIVRASKLRIMEHEMASELNVLARDAARVARQNRRTGDFTRNLLHRALKEMIACFPVYRTYVDSEGTPTEADRRDVDWAVAQARRNEPQLDPTVFDFLQSALTGDLATQPDTGFRRHTVLRLAMRVQQYCGPVMAKGLEDTAFYRYHRFIALNEVGGNPAQFGITPGAFHKANRARAQHWPKAMLTTATHDTKRGEDMRARLAALSEFGPEWNSQVQTWSRILRARQGDVLGTGAPDRNDEYLLYQVLVGSWPFELLEERAPAAMRRYAERIKAAMTKSIREAKIRSSWAMPDLGYEEQVSAFIDSALDPSLGSAFLHAFVPFVRHVARLGARNSVAQTVLKLTSPGVPDTYRGSELWDLSLVDPDNRQPVDFALRQRLLQEVSAALEADRSAAMARYAADWRDPHAKLAVAATLLSLRAERSQLFEGGNYEALPVQGDEGDHICAFRRDAEGASLVVAVTRLPRRVEDHGLPEAATLPIEAGSWREVLRGTTVKSPGSVAVSALFSTLPVAVLVR